MAMNLAFWKKRTGTWIDSMPRRYREYQVSTAGGEPLPGMTSANELCLLETYAREVFTGEGKIVDLGCWLGATTASLARGLAQSKCAGKHRKIEAFDLFEWQDWMAPFVPANGLAKRYAPGQSFCEEVRERLRPYGSLVEVRQQNLLEYAPPPDPIEFLFVDAMKSWALAQQIVKAFFPSLIEGRGYVVQQDFAYFSHAFAATNHLVMWRLRDWFQPVHHVRHSCSVVFRCTRKCSGPLPSLAPGSFSPEEVEAAYEYAKSCVSRKVRGDLEAAKLAFLVEQGHVEPARRQLRLLAKLGSRVPGAAFTEFKRLISERRAMNSACAADGSAAWLDELENWVAAHGNS
jgi:hypothetical protein